MPSYLKVLPRRRKTAVSKRKLKYPGPSPSVAVTQKVQPQTGSKVMLRKKKKSDLTRKPPRKALGGHGTFSMFASGRRPSPRVSVLKKAGQPNIDVHNGAFQVKVAEGFQEAGVTAFQSLDDLERILSRIAPHAKGSRPVTFVLESTTAEFIMTNSSLASLYVDIYDITRKRDALQDDDTKNPVQAWVAGIADESNSSDTHGEMAINSLPTDSKLFQDYFRVVKRTHLSLSQGATHRHMVKLKPNKFFDSAYLDRCDGDVAGTTIYTMIVAYGQPASVPADSGPIITTAAGALDVVVSTRCKYTWVADNNPAWYFTDNLASTTGEQIVSTGSGTIVPNAYV